MAAESGRYGNGRRRSSGAAARSFYNGKDAEGRLSAPGGSERKAAAGEERNVEDSNRNQGDGQEKSAADAAFDRLQALCDELPAMERLGAQLARARSAKHVVEVAGHGQAAKALLAEAEERLVQAQARLSALQQAGDAADSAQLEDALQAVGYFGSQRGFRVGPAANADRDLASALAESPFASLEEAQAAKLPADQFRTLERQVTTFQEDYKKTLDLCERLAR